jgi:hypothetical protein
MYSPRQAFLVLLLLRYLGLESWILGLFSMALAYNSLLLHKYLNQPLQYGYILCLTVVTYGIIVLVFSKTCKLFITTVEWINILDKFIDTVIPICVGVFFGLFDFLSTERISIR